MARAGFCSECSATVWVRDDGSCERGHPASSVSGVYETADAAPTAAPLEAPKKRNTGKIVAISCVVAALLGCLVLGIIAALAVPAFNGAADGAKRNQCFSQQRMVEGAVQMYIAGGDDREMPTDWDTAVQDAQSEGLLAEEPVCPTGGTYTWNDGKVTCSKHGHYE